MSYPGWMTKRVRNTTEPRMTTETAVSAGAISRAMVA